MHEIEKEQFYNELDLALELTIGRMSEREAYEVAVEWGEAQRLALLDLDDDD